MTGYCGVVDIGDCVNVLMTNDVMVTPLHQSNRRPVQVDETAWAPSGPISHSDTEYSNMTDSPHLNNSFDEDPLNTLINPKGMRNYKKSASSADLLTITKANNGNSSGLADNTPGSLGLKSEFVFKYQDSKKLKKRPFKERRFHRLFRNVPLTEVLISRFSCAYIGDMGLLLQGHLYCSDNWICFHSNVFGIEKIIEIPISTVTCITKERTAKIIPNAVGIATYRGKQYLFGSLLSRDNTYQLLARLLDAITTPSSTRINREEHEFDTELPIVHNQDRPLYTDEDFLDDEASESSDDSSSQSSFYMPTQRNMSPKLSPYGCRPTYSIQCFYSWLTQLPILVLILLVCIFLVFCTLLCTGYLALRVVYKQPIQPMLHHMSEDTGRLWTGKIQSMIDSTLENLQQVRQHLYKLKLEAAGSGD